MPPYLPISFQRRFIGGYRTMVSTLGCGPGEKSSILFIHSSLKFLPLRGKEHKYFNCFKQLKETKEINDI